jgi:imidazole glycerol-phosphate synthase subunit HisH
MIKPLILDINSGNILSLKNIILRFSKNVSIGNNDNNILNATHIFLPGVGSYSQVMQNVKNTVNIKLLKKKLLENEAMFLGICVGMQVLSDCGYENGKSEGLSLINGSVKKMDTKEILPHVGWNSINFNKKSKLLNQIPNKSDFYFTHSYSYHLEDSTSVISNTNYGLSFPSIINKLNIYGTQFHPEKSQSNGIKLIKNFLEL